MALADKLVEDNGRASRSARWRRSTSCRRKRRRQPAPDVAVAEATLQTAELALKRYIVSGTDDPLWRQELRPVDLPSLEPRADRHRRRGPPRPRAPDRLDQRAQESRSSDIIAEVLQEPDASALDMVASYGGQGIGGTRFCARALAARRSDTIPGGYGDALRLLTNRDYPNWNFQFNLTYNLFGSAAEAQYARGRVQRQQSQARLRALELRWRPTSPTPLSTVQSNVKRVEAAIAARELAEKRLEAEQSKFEVGMSTNFFVVQAQRDLRDAQNTELRALADYRKSLVTFERAQEAPAGGGGGGNHDHGGTGGAAVDGGPAVRRGPEIEYKSSCANSYRSGIVVGRVAGCGGVLRLHSKGGGAAAAGRTGGR